MIINYEKLKYLAEQFRTAIETADKSQLGISFHDFPNGSCGETTNLLGTFFQKHGYDQFEYVWGVRDGNKSHAWLQYGEVVIDITGDQFEDNPQKIFVGKKSDWFGQFKICGKHKIDWACEKHNILSNAYRVILSHLSESEN